MYGQNPIADKRTEAEGFLVHSIFYTIQGEGPWAGLPTIFLRLAGCNQQCGFCNREFDNGAQQFSLQTLVQRLRDWAFTNNCNRIVITGGEPMLQPLTNLLSYLPEMAFQIETAGTVWPKQFEQVLRTRNVVIVCSPRTPTIHPGIKEYCLHYKYIVDCTVPYNGNGVAEDVFFPNHLMEDPVKVYLQPCDVPDAIQHQANIAQAIKLSLQHGHRLSMQVHKIAGVA